MVWSVGCHVSIKLQGGCHVKCPYYTTGWGAIPHVYYVLVLGVMFCVYNMTGVMSIVHNMLVDFHVNFH